MYRIFVFVTIFFLVGGTQVEKCSEKSEPIAVRIKGCDQPPCKVVKGKVGEFEVDFTAPRKLSAITTKVMATAFGITVPYRLPEEVANVCKNGVQCPLDDGEDATYKFNFPISKLYPEIKVYVELTMVDQNKKPVNCFGVEIQVIH